MWTQSVTRGGFCAASLKLDALGNDFARGKSGRRRRAELLCPWRILCPAATDFRGSSAPFFDTELGLLRGRRTCHSLKLLTGVNSDLFHISAQYVKLYILRINIVRTTGNLLHLKKCENSNVFICHSKFSQRRGSLQKTTRLGIQLSCSKCDSYNKNR